MGFFKNLFGKKEEKESYQKSTQSDTVYYVPSANEKMDWAMEKARLTIGYFKESLVEPKSHQNYFSLKARLEDGKNIEHMWLINPSFDEEGNMFGELNNVPNDLTNVEMGQKVGVSMEQISDWMILEHGNRLIGGYTLRVIRDGMGENEQKAFDQQTGMYIDHGVDYFEMNQETPEGAILSLEDCYKRENIDDAVLYKDFETEASMMLSGRGIPISDEIVTSTAEVLKLSYIKHMTDNGFPSFKNMTQAFRRNKINDDLYVIAEISHHIVNNTWGVDYHYVSRKEGKWFVAGLKDG